ncbi:MAG: AtpZ/AtpI family protein [Eubacteriaceae bacterium]|nr:AtpZ/AtpI family protein [Eubacteriaceae bacterium]
MGIKKDSSYKYLVMISQLGISVIVPIGLMILVGKGLDYFFHTGNVGVIICAILGVLAGLRNLYVIPMRINENAQKMNQKNTEEDKDENEND